MIEIWMKNQLVIGSNCNIVIYNRPMKTNVGVTFSVGDTIPQFTICIDI